MACTGNQMEALYFTPDGASADTAVGPLPDLPVPVNYPQYNSLALLPLGRWNIVPGAPEHLDPVALTERL